MKVKIMFLLMIFSIIQINQTQAQYICGTAISLAPNTGTDHYMDSTEMWFSFIPTGPVCQIICLESSIDSLPDLFSMEVYSGPCNALSLLDSIHFTLQDSIIDFDSLSTDSTYFIRITQNSPDSGYFHLLLLTKNSHYTINCAATPCNLIPNGSFEFDYLTPAAFSTSPVYYTLSNYSQHWIETSSLSTLNGDVCGWGAYRWPRLKGTPPYTTTSNYWVMIPAGMGSIDKQPLLFCEVNNGQPLSMTDTYLLRYQYRRHSQNSTLIECGLANDPRPWNLFYQWRYAIITDDFVLMTPPPPSPPTGWITRERVFSIPPAAAGFKYFYIYTRDFYSGGTIPGTWNVFSFDDFEIIPAIKSITPDQTICEGAQVILEVEPCLDDEGNPNYIPSFHWSASPGDPSLAGQESHTIIFVSPTVSTTYTATVSYPNGLIGTKTTVVTVNPPPPTPIISGTFTACDPQQTYQVQNFDGWLYQYNVSGMSGQNQIFSFPLGQLDFQIDWSLYSFAPNGHIEMTVTATDQNGCTSSQVLKVFDCCQGSYTIQWVDQTISSGTYTNEIIAVDGVLTIQANSTMSFSGCRFYMGGDARIDIEGHSDVMLEGNIFQSCDNLNMWDGIYHTYPSSRLTALGNECYDAKNVFVIGYGARYSVISNRFDRNHSCMLISKNASAALDGDIYLNTFTASGLITLSPYYNVNPVYGIRIEEMVDSPGTPLQIGLATSPSYHNSFSKIDTAIRIFNSDVEIINNTFTDHRVAIRVSGNDKDQYQDPRTLIVGGGDPNEGNYLRVGDYGVLIDLISSSKVYYNTINRFNTGIEVSNSVTTDQYIAHNEIDSFMQHGIFMTNLVSDVQVKENLIGQHMIAGHFASTGITVTLNRFSTDFLYPSQTQVCSNQIGNYGSGQMQIGIHLSACERPHCSNNDIMMDAGGWNAPRVGIITTAQFGQVLEANNISFPAIYSPQEAADESRIGIYMHSTPFSGIASNMITKHVNGIRISADNLPSEFTCNVLTDYHFGFRLEEANFGDQGSGPPQNIAFDNQWFPNLSLPGHQRIFGDLGFVPHRWFFNSSFPFMSLPPGSFNVTPSWLFFANALVQAPSYNCQTLGCDPTPPAPIAPPQGGSTLNFQALHDRTKELDPIFDFLQSATISQSTSFQPFLWSAKYHLYLRILQKPEYLTTGFASDTMYQNIAQSLYHSNIGMVAQVNFRLSDGPSTVTVPTQFAYSPSNAFEQTFKTVQDIYKRNWSVNQYDLSFADSSALYSIALSDPSIHGEAVFLARDMLRMVVFNGNLISPRLAPGDKSQADPGAIKVYPNPSVGIVSIEAEPGSLENGKFVLYDLTGRRVRTFYIEGTGIETFNLGGLKPGVYLYLIHSDQGGNRKEGKLILMD